MLLHFNLFACMHAVLKSFFFCHSYKLLVFMGIIYCPLIATMDLHVAFLLS